jgi:hypothetical protein
MRFVISCYDGDCDGFLNFNEFLYLIKPKINVPQKNKTTKTSSSSIRKLIPEGVRSALLNLLINEYEYACRLNSVLLRLQSQTSLNLDILFKFLDFNKEGNLTEAK